MFDRFDTYRAAWAAVGLALAALLAWVALAFLGTVVFGIFLYYATRPAHRAIRRFVGQPTVSAALALVVLALPLVLLVAYTAAVALQELATVASNIDFGPYASTIEPYLNVSTVVDDPQAALDQVGDPQAALDVLASALGYLGLVGSGLLSLFVAFAIAFYLLRDGHRLAGYGTLLNDDRGTLESYGRAVDESLRDVYFGNILNALLTGVIGAIAYSLLNLAAPPDLAVPSPALVGVLAGAGSLIPVVGMKIVYVPLVLYLGGRAALTGSGFGFVALVAVVSIVIVDLIPDLVLRPYVSGRGLHTGTVMFAYILGPVLFGWYGLFLGPLVLVLVAHFVRLVLPELLAGEPIEADAVDPGGLTGEAAPPDSGDTAGDGTDAAVPADTSDAPEEESAEESPPGTPDSDPAADG
ncbi:MULTISPECIES: AI-2E family transporter [Salinibaculum]|uniref:AI-2E family transporter n=1 Tax=Salinibaculum TaxID=2732368 RepID=UPI0030D34609